MLTIRDEQISAFEQAGQERYLLQMLAYLRAQVPGLVVRLNDATLLSRIGAAVPRARVIGIRSDEGVMAFVALAIAAGPNFLEEARIRKFLDSRADDPELKIRWLYQRVTAKLQALVNELPAA